MMPTLKPLGEAPQVDVEIQSALWDAEPEAAETVRNAVAAVAATIPLQGLGLSVSLTDDATIRSLNRQWRGIDKATNVLSFPRGAYASCHRHKIFRRYHHGLRDAQAGMRRRRT